MTQVPFEVVRVVKTSVTLSPQQSVVSFTRKCKGKTTWLQAPPRHQSLSLGTRRSHILEQKTCRKLMPYTTSFSKYVL